MLKFIRKYRNWAMGVFGVVLMLTFLFGGSSSGMFSNDPMTMTVATIGADKVHRGDLDLATREFEAIKSFTGNLVPSLGIENGVHWYLLAREAERAGMTGEAGDGASFLSDLAEVQLLPLARQTVLEQYAALAGMLRQNPSFLDQLAAEKIRDRAWRDQAMVMLTEEMARARPRIAMSASMTEDAFNLALAKLRGIIRLENSYFNASRVSDLQLIADARRLFESATADAVVVTADRLVNDIPEPTADEVQRHYDAFRSAMPGSGDHGFGYVQPRRVKLEWMRLDYAGISAAVKIDPIAVAKEHQLKRTTYPGDLAVERPKIENALRAAKTDEVLSQFDALYKARLKAATRALSSDGAHKRITSDWQRPTMEALAADLTREVRAGTGVEFPQPDVVVSARDWTRLDRAGVLPGIGSSQYASATARGSFPQVLSALYEFSSDAAIGLQAKVPFEAALVGANQDRFYFTVLDWRDSSSPDSLDEVRADVIADIKRLAAFQRLRAELPRYREVALAEGLTALGKQFERPATGDKPAVPAVPVSPDVVVSRARVANGPTELNDAAFREQVLAISSQLGPTTAPTPENVSVRTIARELPASLAVVVAQVQYPQPITTERLRAMARQDLNVIQAQERRDAGAALDSPFSFEAMKLRTGFKDLFDDASKKPGTSSPGPNSKS